MPHANGRALLPAPDSVARYNTRTANTTGDRSDMSTTPPPDPASGPEPYVEGFETLCAHFGEDRQTYQGAVIPPIFQNSLFTYPDMKTRTEQWGAPGVYDYTRYSNPTTEIVEKKIAALEGGEKARCFGSGM